MGEGCLKAQTSNYKIVSPGNIMYSMLNREHYRVVYYKVAKRVDLKNFH